VITSFGAVPHPHPVPASHAHDLRSARTPWRAGPALHAPACRRVPGACCALARTRRPQRGPHFVTSRAGAWRQARATYRELQCTRL